MLTLLFALLVLDYGRLSGPRRWWWCAAFATVICLTLLAHIGVFVLTGAICMLYLAVRVAQVALTPSSPSQLGKGRRFRGAVLFGVAGVVAAVVAFALFYRYPAHDVLAGSNQQAVEQEGTGVQLAPAPRQYRTGGATPDGSIGLPAITTSHPGVALGIEAWENSWAFYRFWPVVASIAGAYLLASRHSQLPAARAPSGQDEPPGNVDRADAQRDAALTITVWLVVAAVMLVVGIVARLYVRYPLFILPAVALGSGVALAWLVRRWRWGWIAATLLLAFSAVTTLLMWYDRIVYAFRMIV
jgi:hypothetical protein